MKSMPFVWQIPYQFPDKTALAQMQRHFPKPSRLMPWAWFISGTEFFTWPEEQSAESMSARDLVRPIQEIGRGLELFPKSQFVDVWKQWFRYLLPYAIALTNSDRDDSWNPSLLVITCKALMSLYPNSIPDEYLGFRDDLIYTAGTRIIPELLSRDNPDVRNDTASLQNPLFNDIWDLSNSPGMESPGADEDFILPMRFCLKYLTPSEIESWVDSFLKIDSPQWRLAIITWWLKDQPSAAPEAHISSINLDAFTSTMAHYLTPQLFRSWADDMKSHKTFWYHGDSFPISTQLADSIERSLEEFEKSFFRNR